MDYTNCMQYHVCKAKPTNVFRCPKCLMDVTFCDNCQGLLDPSEYYCSSSCFVAHSHLCKECYNKQGLPKAPEYVTGSNQVVKRYGPTEDELPSHVTVNGVVMPLKNEINI